MQHEFSKPSPFPSWFVYPDVEQVVLDKEDDAFPASAGPWISYLSRVLPTEDGAFARAG